ncbi:hypothetical protein M3I54_09945 [Paraburkholderia sp. CNPSo 3274]|uniref:hypothetical protein n=1 Tax=Paraburkholderia sp. CNPSo 3274 TaxID=2940932 RepID=UPI0020B8F6F1|nr:hypothetical protein [Paraburkholderia sp. CNPSo 3274]MCP3707299.1 hypothetical protein [Paraburkholderia sp. CNPSo 3274]
MSKLMIADLSVAQELDRSEMSAVRGGGGLSLWPGYYPAPSFKYDTTNFSAQQLIGQTNTIENNVGNDVAFAQNIHATVNPVQTAHNTINF